MAAEEVDMSEIHGKPQKRDLVCGDCGKNFFMTIFEIIDLTRKIYETKRENANLSERSTDMQAELVETRVAGSGMRRQLEAAERQVAALKGRLADASLTSEKLASRATQTNANLRALVTGVEKLVGAGKTHVKRLEPKCVAEVKKGEQLLTECLEANQ